MVIVAGTIVGMVVAAVAMAQPHGTRDEAKAMVAAAVAHVQKVGAEQAFKDFTNDKANWTKHDLYVFANDMKGTCLAHGGNAKLVGRSLMDLRDANGVMLIAELTKLAQAKGEGWVDYVWQHPQTKKLESKSTYVRKLVDHDGFVGVGVYR
jgi:signal transduction histidine kinase